MTEVAYVAHEDGAVPFSGPSAKRAAQLAAADLATDAEWEPTTTLADSLPVHDSPRPMTLRQRRFRRACGV